MVSLSNLMPPIHHFDDKWSIVMANESTVTSQLNMMMAQLLIWISQHKTGMAKWSIVSSKLSPLISQWIILMSALSLRSLRSSSLYQNGACESGFVVIQHFNWFLSWNFFFLFNYVGYFHQVMGFHLTPVIFQNLHPVALRSSGLCSYDWEACCSDSRKKAQITRKGTGTRIIAIASWFFFFSDLVSLVFCVPLSIWMSTSFPIFGKLLWSYWNYVQSFWRGGYSSYSLVICRLYIFMVFPSSCIFFPFDGIIWFFYFIFSLGIPSSASSIVCVMLSTDLAVFF